MRAVDVLIQGSGIAGSCLYRALAGRGLTVAIEDPHPERAASRAALALLRSAWTPEVSRALAAYAAWGVPTRSGATVTNYRTPGKQSFQRDWHLVDPSAPLVPAEKPGAYTARVAVDCTGTRTFSQGITLGVTWVAEPDALADTELRVHHAAPYKVIAAGVTGGTARLGSSSAKSESLARTQADVMLDKAVELGWTPDRGLWRPILGVRSNAAPGPTCERTGQRSWRFGGFHRVGYATAPVQAPLLADEIEAELCGSST